VCAKYRCRYWFPVASARLVGAAALNHPNIAAIYGLEDRAIVMELVERPTLAERIRSGPLELRDALGIALAIASALEAAHEKGIVSPRPEAGQCQGATGGHRKVQIAALQRLLIEEAQRPHTKRDGAERKFLLAQ
jgi:serine/threonine-protein kinase